MEPERVGGTTVEVDTNLIVADLPARAGGIDEDGHDPHNRQHINVGEEASEVLDAKVEPPLRHVAVACGVVSLSKLGNVLTDAYDAWRIVGHSFR